MGLSGRFGPMRDSWLQMEADAPGSQEDDDDDEEDDDCEDDFVRPARKKPRTIVAASTPLDHNSLRSMQAMAGPTKGKLLSCIRPIIVVALASRYS